MQSCSSVAATNAAAPIGTGGSIATALGPRRMRVRRIAILNDYVRIPYANGSSFASQRLYREFGRRGAEVTVVGPRDPDARVDELPLRHLLLPSIPLRNHPGVYLPLPSRRLLAEAASRHFDVALGQTGTELTEFGLALRAEHGTPFLAVNTIHLPSVYTVILPDWLNRRARVHALFGERIIPRFERHAAAAYNRGDGLIVLSRGLERYWRKRGVEVPIHIIPRSVDPAIFDAPARRDPFDRRAAAGGRLLVLCRHTREKGIERLLRLFAGRIAPRVPEATLTLVGDGPDHDAFRALARELGVETRTFFPGECAAADAPDWYRNADLFVYTSLSETYGQVISEALWCGLPTVALADEMGVSHQIDDGETGVLIHGGADEAARDERFAAAVERILRNPDERRVLSQRARQRARERSAPARAVERHEEAFEAAVRHRRDAPPVRASWQRRVRAELRWAFVHRLLYALGRLRRPAVLNRHGRRPPPWDEAALAEMMLTHRRGTAE